MRDRLSSGDKEERNEAEGKRRRTDPDPLAGLVVQLILLGRVRLALIAQLLGTSTVTRPGSQLRHLVVQVEHDYTTTFTWHMSTVRHVLVCRLTVGKAPVDVSHGLVVSLFVYSGSALSAGTHSSLDMAAWLVSEKSSWTRDNVLVRQVALSPGIVP